METKPLTDRFVQVMLSPQAMVEMLLFLETKMPHPNNRGGFLVQVNKEHTYLFPNIKDRYMPEEIKRIDPV